ncbi:hypothetical protein BURCENK562V_C0899 [Burkholderia cenocepacia K56-2Valvano]|nr:hypothetical protein BURCENK562V_C0899 [Burkholderia cenocepacia K56-2Valvano]
MGQHRSSPCFMPAPRDMCGVAGMTPTVSSGRHAALRPGGLNRHAAVERIFP